MPPKELSKRYLTIDELAPAVDVASYYRLPASDYSFGCRLPAHHLLLVESGRIHARTPDGELHAKAGDLFCFRPTEWSEYNVTEAALFYQAHVWFVPPPQVQRTPTLGRLGPLPIKVSLGRSFPEMRQVFETICIEITQAGPVSQLRIRAAVHEILAIIAAVLTRDRSTPQHLDGWQRLQMRLDTELHGELSVEAMARQMNLSRSYFIHAFRERFGVTPRLYHTHARLREAARLLRHTDKSVKAVAYDLGFPNARAFTRLFKSRLGVLPSDIRTGVAAAPTDAPRTARGLFPMNQHLLPPQAAANWEDQFAPRRSR